MNLKFEEKPFKFDASKQHVFGFEFRMDFLRFGLQKRRQNRAICAFLSKTQILQKSLFSLGKIAIFLVRSLEKSTKIGCSKAMKNNVEKKASKIEFGSPFGPPKSLKIGPKSDVKRNSLRDAMETMRNSSQVNGTHMGFIGFMGGNGTFPGRGRASRRRRRRTRLKST